MNRLPTLLAPNISYADRKPAVGLPIEDFNTTLPVELAHQVYLPQSFTPTYDYPLVIWLHSDDSSEMELTPVMETLSEQNYIGIAPRANIRSQSQRRVFRWGDTRADYAYAEDVVWECINASLETLPVHPGRIFLAGFGRGGTLAQWIGLQYAERIAGVVSLSGPAPTIGGALSHWKNARDLPLLFAQRQGSSLCSDQCLNNAMRLAHRAALNYTFWQLQDEVDSFDDSDDLSSSMLLAANRFMMSIVTGSPCNLQPEPSREQWVGPFGIN
ncbi:MAG: PHB depolymerase family esterase [Pirellula sp.]|jgi:phospholipase/carboxylesterase|nr:PHB depolymerase family esterase [Pirellula sp.]